MKESGLEREPQSGREAFSADLSDQLQEHSARALATRSGWGRTTVTEIKAGRQLPSAAQLEDILEAAGASASTIRSMAARLEQVVTGREPPRGKTRFEEMRRRWPARTQLAAGLSVVMVLASGLVWWAASRWYQEPSTHGVSGEVRCQTGVQVVGVWLSYESGGGVWARVRATSNEFVLIDGPVPGRYRLHVGCGGTPTQWKAEARSAWYTGDDFTLICDDSPSAVAVPPYLGRCRKPDAR